MRAGALVTLCMLVASCSGEDAAPEQTTEIPRDPLATPAPLPPQVSDFPALASRDCGEVARFYFAAIAGHDFTRAALAWDDPVIDRARLQALFAGYQRPRFTAGDRVEEGAAGSLHCTVAATLSDAADPAKAPAEGTLQLRRVNDVPGATADQLRWTIRSSTFVEPTERSSRGEGE